MYFFLCILFPLGGSVFITIIMILIIVVWIAFVLYWLIYSSIIYGLFKYYYFRKHNSLLFMYKDFTNRTKKRVVIAQAVRTGSKISLSGGRKFPPLAKKKSK